MLTIGLGFAKYGAYEYVVCQVLYYLTILGVIKSSNALLED